MALTVSEFWRLAEDSQLFSAGCCADLRRRWRDVRGSNQASSARTLAEWLIAEGELTRYQAKLLLAGQAGPFRFGEYLLEKRLRKGGLSDCFQAVHAPTRFPVTLRFVRGTAFAPTVDIVDVQRLFEEAPRGEGAVVPFREWVDCGAYQFGVFDRVGGGPVTELLAERGKLDAATACRIVHRVAVGLAALHRRGLAHGAVRPEMIWVGDEERVALLPRQLSESWAALRGEKPWLSGGRDPAAIGIAQYTAPEAAGRRAVAAASGDVYALGCVLYALLAGKPPFRGSTVEEILQQHAAEGVPPLRRRTVPERLVRVLHQLLPKDVSQRLRDAQDVAEALAKAASAAKIALPRAAGGTPEEVDAEAGTRRAYTDWLPRRSTAAGPAVLPVATPRERAATFAPEGEVLPPEAPPSAGAPPPVDASRDALASRTGRRGSRRRQAVDWMTVGGALLLAVATAVGLGLWNAGGGTEKVLSEANPESPDVPSKPSDPISSNRSADALWASPTKGPPVSTRYLAPGTQGVFTVRLADLLAHPEGERILAAIGPHLRGFLDAMPAATGFEPGEISRLTIGWQAGGPVGWENVCLVVELVGDRRISHGGLIDRLDGAQQVQIEREPAVLREDVAYWLPAAGEGRVVVVVAADEMPLIVRQGSIPPPLPRDVDRLLAESDAERHVTLVVPPRLVLGDGRDLLARHAAALRDPLQWFLGDKTRAVSLSLHWNENFFAELQAVAAAEVLPSELGAGLYEHVSELPRRVEDWLLEGPTQPYGQRLLLRFPEMLRRMVAYTRWAADTDRAVLRCYLPLPAGHNLLMAGEIALAETYARGTSGPRAAAPPPKSVEERLAEVTSLSFPRDTLEAALQMLSADIGVPIEIIGSDLQVEGITRNQSLSLDLRNRPARQILVEILRLANPDKTAPSASDLRQSLVFVIQPNEAGEDAVYITTRKAAQERGMSLPEEFLDMP